MSFKLTLLFIVSFLKGINLSYSQELINNFKDLPDSVKKDSIHKVLNKIKPVSIDHIKDEHNKIINFCVDNNYFFGEAIAKTNLFIKLAVYKYNTDSLLNLSNEIELKYLDTINPQNQITFHYLKAGIFLYKNDYERCLLEANKLEVKAEKENLSKYYAFSIKGMVSEKLLKFQDCIDWQKKAARELDSTKIDLSLKALTYRNISVTYDRLNDVDSALHYIDKSLAIDSLNLTSKFSQVNLLLSKNKYQKAKIELEKANEIYSKKDNGSKNLYRPSYCKTNAKYNILSNNFERALAFSDSLIDKLDTNQTFELKIAYILKIKAILKDDNILMDKLNNLYLKEYNQDILSKTIDYEKKYDLLNKQKNISKLENEKQNLQIKTFKRTIFLIIGIGLLLISLLLGILFYRKAKRQDTLQIEKLRKQALQLQMNPHFFFNSLNSINNYIQDNDKKKARYYLSKFSRLMRLTLENSQNDLIEIEREFEFLENYLAIEQIRKHNFEYSVNFDETLSNYKIPPMLIQPLIENSIKHAFNDNQKGKIKVTAIKNKQGILISVEDNGIGIMNSNDKKETHKSMAISILKKRIDLFTNGEGNIKYSNLENSTGTKVSINLPYFL